MKLNETKVTIAMAKAQLNAFALCEKAGIQYATYHRIINGKPCKPATAGKIAAALGVRVEELFKNEKGE